MPAAGEGVARLPSWSPAQAQLELVRLCLLWLTGLSGSIVLVEPSPYEVLSLATLVVFMASGLTLRAPLVPLIALLFLINLGFTIALFPVLERERTVQWVAVSWYLAVTCVFFAAMLAVNTRRRLEVLLSGCLAGAVLASVAAIGGYFELFGGLSGLFVRHARAQGTFNDPNVLGAFLCVPALIALQRTLMGRGISRVAHAALLLLICAALLLSFSRGAWGNFAFSGALLLFLMFLTARSAIERLRVVMTAGAGVVLLVVFLIALLSIDAVGDLFRQRANLEQSYDLGPMGRFGRHVRGFMLALDHPLGIGPLQFGRYFPEDAHNSYLNAFVSGGWLAGFSYLALIGATLVAATRQVLAPTPWRPTMLVVYAGFVGTAAESLIIDSDHWRHYALLIGVMWGLTLASAAYRRSAGADKPSNTQALRDAPSPRTGSASCVGA